MLCGTLWLFWFFFINVKKNIIFVGGKEKT